MNGDASELVPDGRIVAGESDDSRAADFLSDVQRNRPPQRSGTGVQLWEQRKPGPRWQS